jgi:hypothetical protein
VITLGATATSGLTVAYSVTSGPATVTGNQLTVTGGGSITVQATQAGNGSYNAATPVSVSFTSRSLSEDQLEAIARTAAGMHDLIQLGFVLGYCAGTSKVPIREMFDAAAKSGKAVFTAAERTALATAIANA